LVDGVDALYVGSRDLSVNLGIPLQYDHPEFQDALRRVLKACEKYDKVPGIHAFSPEQESRYIEMDFRFIVLMTDIGVMLSAFRDMLKALKRSGELQLQTRFSVHDF